MATRQSARAALERLIHKTEESKFDYGYLGRRNSAGTEYEFKIPEKPGRVYCQIVRGLNVEHADCVPRVALDPYVLCKFKTVRGILVAFEFDPIDGVNAYGDTSGALDLPAFPLPEFGAIPLPPMFDLPTVKLLQDGVASAGKDRFLKLAAETGTSDTCVGLTGLEVGDEVWLFADAGHTITLAHDSTGTDDLFFFYNETDIVITETKGLRVMKRASGAIVNSIDDSGGSSGMAGILLYPTGGGAPTAFDADATGFGDANTAASAGDVIFLPAATISGDHTLVAGVEYVGVGREQTILSGQITGADETVLRDLTIARSASSSSALTALRVTTGDVRAYNCTLEAVQLGSGTAIGAEVSGGTLELNQCIVRGDSTSGSGYGTFNGGGALTLIGGQRIGSTEAGWTGIAEPTALASNGVSQPQHPTISGPPAYFYNGKTYVVWQGTTSVVPFINVYDHASETWDTQVQVGTDAISPVDGHGAPIVMVDDDGYIHVYWLGSPTADLPIKHAISDSPEDISSWSSPTDIGTNTTYKFAIKANDGTIWIAFREKYSSNWHRHSIANSGDNYATIQPIIMSSNALHAVYTGNLEYDAVSERIWISWCYYNGSTRNHQYAAYYDLGDGHIHGADGTDFGVELSKAEADGSASVLAVDTGTDQTNIGSIRLDSSGRPHMIFTRSVGGVFQHQYTRWTGSAWTTAATITLAGNSFNHSDFYFREDGVIEAYLTTNSSGGRSGNMDHWRRETDGTWHFIRRVFDIADAAYEGAANPQIVGNTGDDAVIKTVFSETDALVYSHADLNVYAIDTDDSYIVDGGSSAMTQLNAVQTDPAINDSPLPGDRAAWDVTDPTLHAQDIAAGTPTIHVPAPTAADKWLKAVDDGAGGFMWQETDAPSDLEGVTASAPLTATGTTTRNIALDASGVSAGSYVNADITVDTFGRVTAAANGSVAAGEILVEDGACAPPVMLTTEDECDFLYEG